MSQIHGSPKVASVLSTRERAQSPLVFNNRPIDIASIGTRNEVDSEFEAHLDGYDDSDEWESFGLLKKRVDALKKEVGADSGYIALLHALLPDYSY